MRRLRIFIPVAVTLLMFLLPGRGHAQVGTVIPTPSPQPTALPTPRPATVTRSFHCNCTSPGNPVLWAGNVRALSYFQARQMGTSQCLAYLGFKPTSPLIPTPVVALPAIPPFAPLGVNPCSSCACN
ncbi:MAG TPA: hypothetical protein VN754_11590 [Candidatus Binataceae bacterium]|nr:hypothetical protein [Candidatus Binataceae bacterium]